MLLHLGVSVFIAAVTLMALFPRTPAAKAIRRVLVEAPTSFLTDLTWAKAVQLAMSIAVVGAMLIIPEMAMVMASLGADAAILEVMAVIWVASLSGSFTSAWRSIRQAAAATGRIAARTVRAIARPRGARHRRRKPGHGRKDDADGPEWVFA